MAEVGSLEQNIWRQDQEKWIKKEDDDDGFLAELSDLLFDSPLAQKESRRKDFMLVHVR